MRTNKIAFIESFVISLIILFLSGCSLMGPVNIVPPKKYILDELPTLIPLKQTHSTTLLVLEPETRPIYNTTQMAYTIQPHQIAFFSFNEWTETPSQMLHPLIVKVFQDTHYFSAIGTSPYVGNYDYVLSVQILELQQDYILYPAMMRLTLRAQLSHKMTQQFIATQEFSILEPILQRTPYAGVIAANHATAKIIQKLVEFTLSKAK